ncbi:hypothetical protein FOXB_11228 [Fusarium oxysporum f. sp. conglutinans Fo5176]|uniref:Xylanolytic transcriptional activator regulatory domain-containing protein n=1 Tax=Fusarium oxysporum (strain Fo5176) TaxID=660025 RepID=F9FXU6_FUSOF|nr:hypothetical protein FOXB_11228 [Fusarium oxysporum f. sp. conglutinans Fo5176]
MSASPSSGGGTFGAATSAHRLSTRVISVSRHAPVVSSAARHVATQQHVAGPGQRRAPGASHGESVIGGILDATIQGNSISEDTISLAAAVSDLPSESPVSLVTSHAPTQVSNQSSQGPNILPEEEAYLELVEALLLITAKLLGFKFASTHFDLDGRIDQILSNTTLQEDTAGDFPSLDLFRKFCLLVFYEFHQFPGQQAWVRIGKIVRLAYWMGLDRLDIIQSVSPEWSNVSDADLQNWKLVWWCVYRLDSYANLSSGTPYQVDERLVNTSLNHQGQLSQGFAAPCRLPHDPCGLPDLLLLVKAGSESSLLFNIHLITITVLRQFGRAMSMRYLVPHESLTVILLDAERTLSAIRLALPRNFLNPGRNAFMNESNTNHHARLASVLHLHMAQLLAALASCYYLPEGDDWTLSWQRVLETCQNIAGIAEKWDSNYTLTVDPALSLISLTALVFLDIHKKYTESTNTHLISEIENCELLLLLQLEQFSAYWKLPSLLILSFKSFKESVTGPLSYPHIQLILSRFESPLHPRWLQFLSSAQTHLENVIWGHGT